MIPHNHIRILILGDSGVGKSTFVYSFINGYTVKKMIYPTVGVNVDPTKIIYQNIEYKLFFYDCSGQDKYKHFISNYYRDLNCIIFMYDLTSSESKDKIKTLINDAKETLSSKYNRNINDICCTIIGNKYDLLVNMNDNEKNDILNQCKALSEDTNMSVILCSSKQKLESYTSRSCIYCIIHDLYEYHKDEIVPMVTESNIILKKNEEIENDDNCACISQ
jgi:small GTP-binding protein